MIERQRHLSDYDEKYMRKNWFEQRCKKKTEAERDKLRNKEMVKDPCIYPLAGLC